MTADSDLPVWTIRPNWREPLIERLSWLTDVLATSYGTEQRRALRLSPRREFEMLFNPVDQTRSYFELFLHRLGSQEFMLPLFHDAGRLSATVATGDLIIPVDTTYREFVAGGLAILLDSRDPFVFEKVTIAAVATDSITITGAVTKTWGKGATIHPLRRSRLDQDSAASALTSRASEATIRFQLNQANDIPDEGTWHVLLGDYPLFTDKPNWRETVDLDFARNSLLLDNDHGLRELGDDAGRAFTLQSHSAMMTGRAAHWAFRQFLYRLRGQQGAIWVPSFKRDVELSRAAITGDLALDIKNIGYEYTGGAVSGRTRLWFGGEITAEINGVDNALTGAEERLTLAAALTDNLALGSYGSFLDACRLASDDIEITHHTDTDGTAECNLGFRSFRDERVPPDPDYSPIPFGQLKTPDLCGAPDTAACVPDLTAGSSGPAEDGSGDDPDSGGGGPGPGAGDDVELGGYLFVQFSRGLTSSTDPTFVAHPQFDLKLNGQSIASVTFADDTSATYMATILFGSEALKYHSLLDAENEETQTFYPLPVPALARTDAGADPSYWGGSNLPEYYVFQPGGSILSGYGMTIWDGCLAPSTNDTDGTPKIIGGGVIRHDDIAASPLNPLGENTLSVTVSNVVSGKGATDNVDVYLVGEFFSRTLRDVDSGWRDGDSRVNDTPMYFQADADNSGGADGVNVAWWRAYNGLVPGAILSPVASDPSFDPDPVARVADLVFDLSK